MTRITCLIVDDEPLALDLLERYIGKTPFLDLKGRCSSAIEALTVLNTTKIELLFLDIQMPELSGIEFSTTLRNDIKVVFTTAFSKYAVDGFKVSAIDYLLKPFNYEEFLKAATKAKDWFDSRRSRQNPPNGTGSSGIIFVKSEYKQVKIDLNEVLCFEGMKDYVKIWISGKPKPVMTIMSLKSLEGMLPAPDFMRIHRSFIISFNKIVQVEQNQVVLANNFHITVADPYKEMFRKFLSEKSVT
jgi:DNA-binding LytR/AlgR family response regulator